MSNQTLSVIPLDPDLYRMKRKEIVPVTALVPLSTLARMEMTSIGKEAGCEGRSPDVSFLNHDAYQYR